ncbi:hypothetical protein [Bradymonas sediminis]|uniref:Uncharacterized protein n=1 Tax=Bradymonas sediminis TaxID=1548548 RepID=A0A2Z4FGP1_9DELT|nr:hypothetical protein [Bradymonas sediminis]AWV87958.1 hypothetical protein DN745_00880 [Bradymonas sediminis]TDP62978.1 hypothetical protein DFR33_111111 [Bradymonas sediminis]
MTADHPAHQLIDDSQTLIDNSKRVINDAQQLYDRVREDLSPKQLYQDNPFAVVAAAAGVGYILGGGLFTPFTRRIVRIGLKGLIIPIASSQLKHLTAGVPSSPPPFSSGE